MLTKQANFDNSNKEYTTVSIGKYSYHFNKSYKTFVDVNDVIALSNTTRSKMLKHEHVAHTLSKYEDNAGENNNNIRKKGAKPKDNSKQKYYLARDIAKSIMYALGEDTICTFVQAVTAFSSYVDENAVSIAIVKHMTPDSTVPKYKFFKKKTSIMDSELDKFIKKNDKNSDGLASSVIYKVDNDRADMVGILKQIKVDLSVRKSDIVHANNDKSSKYPYGCIECRYNTFTIFGEATEEYVLNAIEEDYDNIVEAFTPPSPTE